jgi:hypothetical protein
MVGGKAGAMSGAISLRARLWQRFGLTVAPNRTCDGWCVVDVVTGEPVAEYAALEDASNACDRIARDMLEVEKRMPPTGAA